MNETRQSSPEMDAQHDHYRLSAELIGHDADVRSVCVVSTEQGYGVVTCSRDKSVRLWLPNSQSGHWENVQTMLGHSHFVSVVTALPKGSSQLPKGGGVASGGNDNIINIWDLEAPGEPAMVLIGHDKPVVSLAVAGNGDLVSGSWDHTVRVWRGVECIQVLRGHTQAVWAVLPLPDGSILTGSADKEIRLWKDGVCVHTYQGHTDCVRDLKLVENVGFLSCGNDGLIRLWAFSGEPLQDLYGHSSFIFSASVLPDHTFATGGEDRALKIWRDSTCQQTIMHPSTVWCVAALPNTDIITASSDGVARLWTRDPSRTASAEEIASYESKVSAVAIPKQTTGAVGELNTERLPGPEALEQPGTKDQQNLIIKNGSVVEVYQWQLAEGRWQKMGEVVDAVGTSAKAVLQGVEYDHIFDVEIGDGQPPRKLGYNVTENPYVVAQQFLEREELDQGFLDQVANFIIENSRAVTLGDSSTGASDPYTGSGRYIPGSASAPSSTAFQDPFTGSHRYIPGTGSGAQQPPQPVSTPTTELLPHQVPSALREAPTTQSPYQHIPVTSILQYDTAKIDPALNKLLEFNGRMQGEEDTKAVALNESQVKALTEIVAILKQTSRYHATTFTDGQFVLMCKLAQWPEKYRFPGLDILRLMVLHPHAVDYFAVAYATKRFDIITVLTKSLVSESGGTPPAANVIMALRVLCNTFLRQKLRVIICGAIEQVLEAVADCQHNSSLPVRTALATILLNYGVHCLQQAGNNAEERDGHKAQCMDILSSLLAKPEQDAELAYRCLVAVGTLAWEDPATRSLALDMELLPSLQQHYANHEAAKVKEAASELLQFFLSK
ncbi:Phospholipase A2 activating protein [Balamuthia mandrillaris]